MIPESLPVLHLCTVWLWENVFPSLSPVHKRENNTRCIHASKTDSVREGEGV